jgi:hypothetical protein
MQDRTGARARTDFDVVARDGGMACHCRAVDLSASGILVDRGREVRTTDQRLLVDLELCLPERPDVWLHATGRFVWSLGSQQAFRFVVMNDVDRLTVAQHIDLLRLGGVSVF